MALDHQVAMADASQLVSLRYKKQLKTKSVLQVKLSNKQADEAFCDFYSQFKTAWAREMDQWVKNLSCKCDGRSSDFSAHKKKRRVHCSTQEAEKGSPGISCLVRLAKSGV